MAPARVGAWCTDIVTLTCSVNISDPRGIKLLTWTANNKSCEQGLECERTEKSVTLTLLYVMPAHQGSYLCKLQSNEGEKSATTILTVTSVYRLTL